ncbi:urea transporter family protein [Collimonas arenae]|uniref:Urea transporter family protein n=1 Tax=Collimonas arenae TaxID=279058 RepID=A0A127QJ99_9BURK|nr:urea transporter [Collimonas arenae]AMP00263.1 urea transporter family protein [Collimonas arenae]AMP10139.1 urea transporter family protein [Collimonas arenae]
MGAVRAIFLGISQSMFQQNGYTGLIFLLGVFLSSPWVGLAALLGVTASTATAWAIGAERHLVLVGVYGFNGFFAGVALGSIFSPSPLLWMVVVIAGALSTLLMHALHRLLGRIQLPALSAPFVCVLWLILFSVIHVGRLAYAQGPVAGVSGHLLSDTTLAWAGQFTNRQDIAGLLLNGTLRGVSQIFYQDDLIAGLIFLLGLSVSTTRAAMVAAAGSFTGALTALLIGAPDLAIFHGIYGFNSVLSALAVITLSQKPGWRAIAMALLCAAFAAIATSVMIPLSQSAGLPALSAPFCVASWMFLLALRRRHSSQAG